MMLFLPISILAYALNAGSIIIDKILLQKAIPQPIVYTFYINIFGLLALFLLPFGFEKPNNIAVYMGIAAGITFVAALYSFFTSLKINAASVAGPVVGALNPLFGFLIGSLFLQQILQNHQIAAIIILVTGSLIIAIPLAERRIAHTVHLKQLSWMVCAGFLFGLSYVFLRETFLVTTFFNGLVISRVAAGVCALSFLTIPMLREQIFEQHSQTAPTSRKSIFLLLFTGQALGASSGLLITYGVSLANPALVNSLFGVQYLVILVAAIIFSRQKHSLLEEKLTTRAIAQKSIGVALLSVGLYLLLAN